MPVYAVIADALPAAVPLLLRVHEALDVHAPPGAAREELALPLDEAARQQVRAPLVLRLGERVDDVQDPLPLFGER